MRSISDHANSQGFDWFRCGITQPALCVRCSDASQRIRHLQVPRHLQVLGFLGLRDRVRILRPAMDPNLICDQFSTDLLVPATQKSTMLPLVPEISVCGVDSVT